MHAWAFAGDWEDGQKPDSNTFAMEWPRGSGTMVDFPEVDDARFADARPEPHPRRDLLRMRQGAPKARVELGRLRLLPLSVWELQGSFRGEQVLPLRGAAGRRVQRADA